MSDRELLWIWLSQGVVTGSRISDTLCDEFECDIEQIYSLDRGDLLAVTGSERVAAALADKSLDKAKTTAEWCGENGVGVLTPDSPLYPARLKRIMSRPVLLYYIGEPISTDDRFTLAMVGTRKMTEYGRQSAYTIALESARCGAIVVSGMAAGIDGVCHRGAMDGGGYTIAVLGCGIDKPYPSMHEDLMREIGRKGLVVSEYQPFTPPYGYNFPIRNRIISGLSACTLAVEGDRKSGAMITARSALYQGRDLCALPGKVGESSSEGTNELIKNGARIVTDAYDVLEPYRYVALGLDMSRLTVKRRDMKAKTPSAPAVPAETVKKPEEASTVTKSPSGRTTVRIGGGKKPKPEEKPAEEPKKTPPPDAAMLSDDERRLLDMMGDDVVSADRFFDDFGGSRVLTMMSLMEIKGFIRSVPGGMYRKL